jgi:site-specific recombinase XerD
MTEEQIQKLALILSKIEIQGNRLTAETQRFILDSQRNFLAWLNRKGYSLIGVREKELKEYYDYLYSLKSQRTKKRLATKTINNRYRVVGNVFFLLLREGIIDKNPFGKVTLQAEKEIGLSRRPLTRHEITCFLDSLDPHTPIGIRDKALFELIYSSGLRVSEAAKLMVWDIDFDQREMVVRGKRDKDRIIPFTVTAKNILVKYLGTRINNPEDWVFQGKTSGTHIKSKSISGRFRYILRNLGMDKKEISTHSIRHSTASHLLENGASVRHVQELLGHKNIQTTVRYTHIQIEGLLKEYDKYHPRGHDLYEKVDSDYWKRLEVLFGAHDPPFTGVKTPSCGKKRKKTG